MSLKSIVKPFARLIARFYWVFLKEEIDSFELNLQKPRFKYLGQKVVFKGKGMIFHPENIVIEDYVKFSDNYFMMGLGGIEIGKGSRFGMNVVIHSGNHDFRNTTTAPYGKGHVTKKTSIGRGVWVGSNVNILAGVTIGDGAIIGTGTTVSKQVNPYEIVVGAGHRVIGTRDKETFEKAILNEDYFGKRYH